NGGRFSAQSANMATSSTCFRRSSGTSPVANERHARWRWTTSKNSGIEAPEGVDVEDAQGGMEGPVVERGRAGPAAQVLGDAVGHAFEPAFGIARGQLVQVQEARVTATHVLVGRDHQPVAVVRGG